MRHVPRTVALICALVSGLALTASAELTDYDTATYDYFGLGAPKFVKTNYIDLNKVTQISRFRSFAGHDYSDYLQFGISDAYKAPNYAPESCRNMKHYFRPPDDNTVIRAPVSGVISRIFEEELGTQIHITSDAEPAFTFSIFHIVTPAPATVGTHVDEGQILGHHWGQQTDSDIAVAVHTPRGYHLISYFETLTDDLFAQFQARGIPSRDAMIISKETYDAVQKGNPNPCALFTNGVNDDAQFVKMTGGAATQQISFTYDFAPQYHTGDVVTYKATASSGLPVTIVSTAPKVCVAEGLTVTYRRPGRCLLKVTQDGDANTFPAPFYPVSVTVAPPGAGFAGLPRLGAVFPPSATGSQSYFRFVGSYYPGTVTLTLTDAVTGKDKLTWTSPTVAAYTAPQVSIADIEKTAPAGYQRPALYGARIESATTLPGNIQHVLYHPADGTLTNLSTCDSGVGVPGQFIGNVHSSLLAGYPSAIAYHNPTRYDFLNIFLGFFDAASGKSLGYYTIDVSKLALNQPVMPVNSGAILQVSDLERTLRIAPPGNHYFITASSAPSGAFFQHLVTSQQAGVVADMTTVCSLAGGGMAAPGAPLRGGALFGTTQGSSQSYVRFYNAGTTAGPVNLTLYDMATGAALGQWTSPSLAPGAELQTQIGEIETALGAAPRDNYDFRVDTDIDGYFQHVLWRTSDGTLTNLSTCAAGVTADPYALMGVHSSLVGTQGYPSAVNVVNTGADAQTVSLGLYDARDGSRLGTYRTPPLPAGGQIMLDVGALEQAAKITPSATLFHYVVKVDTPFTGFLQHLMNNQRSGVITDMTTVCAM